MHNIEMHEMSPEFLACWQAAGTHLNGQVDAGIQSWLRAHPHPPVLEHLSFRLGNQLFFVRIEDADGKIIGPGNLQGLHTISEECQGRACLMPMKKSLFGNDWVPVHSGWGLISAETGLPIDPIALVSDEKIPMTRWELQDFAVQVVRHQLERDGYQLMSWQSNPFVDPAIWFVGDSQRPEWVVARAACYPDEKAEPPSNWDAIAAGCARLSTVGHFASVGFVGIDDLPATAEDGPMPIYRGHGVDVSYEGLTQPT